MIKKFTSMQEEAEVWRTNDDSLESEPVLVLNLQKLWLVRVYKNRLLTLYPKIQEQAMMEDKQEWGCDCNTFKECNPQKKEKGQLLFIHWC